MTQDLSDLKLEEWERIARECEDYYRRTSARDHPPWPDPAPMHRFGETFAPLAVLSLLSALKEAREALRPFARAAAEMADLPEGWAVLLRPRDYAAERGAPPVSDFRRASQAFTTLGGSEHER